MAPRWRHAGSTIIVQIDPTERADGEAEALLNWRERDWRRYGNTALWFLQAPAE